MTRKNFAKMLGISYSSVCQYERNNARPSVDVICKYYERFPIFDFNELLEYYEELEQEQNESISSNQKK